MAGLFGEGWQDPQSAANMALAAGLIRGQFGAGLIGANAAFREATNDQVKRRALEADMAERLSHAEERKTRLELARRNQDFQQRLLYGDMPSVAPSASPGASASVGGGFGAPQGASGAGGLIAQARSLGIPEQAIQADVAFNGGKGLSDMLFKRGTPDMQVTNGFAYDKNRTGPGYLPQLNTSQDGKTSMVQIGPDGLPVVSAPSGALNTYAGYRNVDESAKANFDPVTITPQGQNPQMTSRGALMRNPQVQGQIPQGVQSGRDAGRAEILQQEVTKAQAQLAAALRSGDSTAAQRATNDLTALNRELGAAGGASRATLGLPLQSKAEEAASVEQAKADVMPTQQRQTAIDVNRQTLGVLDKALNHPGLDTATGLSGTIDPRNYIPGTDAKDFNVVMDQIKGKAFLQAFQTLKGGGQITEVEGKKATDAIARLNTAQSTPEFKKALMELRDVAVSANARMTGSDGQKPTQVTPPTPTPGMVRGGYRFKGGNPADKNNWEKQ
jgi:hypothetical protein